jgi:hypothetical protein
VYIYQKNLPFHISFSFYIFMHVFECYLADEETLSFSWCYVYLWILANCTLLIETGTLKFNVQNWDKQLSVPNKGLARKKPTIVEAFQSPLPIPDGITDGGLISHSYPTLMSIVRSTDYNTHYHRFHWLFPILYLI